MGCGFPRGGGRHQLSGGPSLLTSTPVSCRWGQRGRKIKEKVFFTVRHILFQMKHLEFVSCATFSFQVQSAILKLKEFPFMTLMMITPECFWKHLAIKCHLDFAPLSECCVEKDGDSCGAAFSQRTIREMARNLCCHTNLPNSVLIPTYPIVCHTTITNLYQPTQYWPGPKRLIVLTEIYYNDNQYCAIPQPLTNTSLPTYHLSHLPTHLCLASSSWCATSSCLLSCLCYSSYQDCLQGRF